MNKSKIRLFGLIVTLLWCVSCNEGDRFEFPGVFVDFSINIYNDVEFYSLQAAGNSMVITASMVGVISLGYNNNGVIVFNNGDEFYAFDRTCPHDYPEKSVAVESDGGTYAECPECGSGFIFTTGGTPTGGSVSRYALKTYRTELYAGSGALHVYN